MSGQLPLVWYDTLTVYLQATELDMKPDLGTIDLRAISADCPQTTPTIIHAASFVTKYLKGTTNVLRMSTCIMIMKPYKSIVQ